jgi:hypothetical protein
MQLREACRIESGIGIITCLLQGTRNSDAMQLNMTAIRCPENPCQVRLSPSHVEEWHLCKGQLQPRHVV